MSERVYLDYAASTPLDKRVKEAMEPFWDGLFANPGSKHDDGRKAREHVEKSREEIAQIIGVKKDEILFTSGGTESNSLAIIGFLNYLDDMNSLKDAHIITSPVEHPSVLAIFQKYKKKGIRVDFAPVTSEGLIDQKNLEELINKDTKLVSIVYANSEIGVVQPLRELSSLIKNKNPETIFHTDASQAPLWLPTKAESLKVDMMTFDGQKIYGPKGVGVLYKKSRVNISPVLLGGSQEKGLRPGTENTPLIIGMSRALKIAEEERKEVVKKILPLREGLIDSLLALDKRIVLNGSRRERSAGNINVSVLGEDNEFLQTKLDKEGISCSTKSACISEKEEGSYVLKALGISDRKSGIRFTLGKDTTEKEIKRAVEAFKKII